GGGAAVLEDPDAAGRASRVRDAGADPLDRAPGESGEHDGDVRAVRAAGDPQDERPRASVPARGAGAPGRAGGGEAPAAALSPGGGDGGDGRARGPAHRAAGLGDSDLDGAGERAPGAPGGAVREPGGERGAGAAARRPGAPGGAGVLMAGPARPSGAVLYEVTLEPEAGLAEAVE